MMCLMPPLFVRGHNMKDWVMERFPLKSCKWSGWGDAEVRRDKRHPLKSLEKLLKDRCGPTHLKLDHANRFGAATTDEVRCTRGTEIPHPVDLPKGSHQPPFIALSDQGHWGGRDLPALAPANREQHQGAQWHPGTQQRLDQRCAQAHRTGHANRLCCRHRILRSRFRCSTLLTPAAVCNSFHRRGSSLSPL